MHCEVFNLDPASVASNLGTEKDPSRDTIKVQAVVGKDMIGDQRITYEKIKGYTSGKIYSIIGETRSTELKITMIMEGQHTVASFFKAQNDGNDFTGYIAVFCGFLSFCCIAYLSK